MNHLRLKNCHTCYTSLFFILVSLFINISCGFPQVVRDQQRIYFISDVQKPMRTEKIISKQYRNEEARDSLFADIIRQHPKNLFMLGDLTSQGSKEKAWVPLDTFLDSLNKINTKVYAIPGNHEYMGESTGMKLFKNRFPEQFQHPQYIYRV